MKLINRIKKRLLEDSSPHPYAYGRYYWYVLTPNEEIYLNADKVKVVCGCLQLWGHSPSNKYKKQLLFTFAPNQWIHTYAASCFDGDPVTLEHWKWLKKK